MRRNKFVDQHLQKSLVLLRSTISQRGYASIQMWSLPVLFLCGSFFLMGLMLNVMQRRRDRINEKMRALQELIPRCNKVVILPFIESK